MKRHRYQYYNALSNIQLTQSSSACSLNLCTPKKVEIDLKSKQNQFEEQTKWNQKRNVDNKKNAYEEIEGTTKRPQAYYNFSWEKANRQQLQKLYQKETNYASSKEYLEYLQNIKENTPNEEQIIKQMKKNRNNNVYLSLSHQKTEPEHEFSPEFQTKKEATQPQIKGYYVVEGAELGWSIDQLSNIEEKDTFNFEEKDPAKCDPILINDSYSISPRKTPELIKKEEKLASLKQYKQTVIKDNRLQVCYDFPKAKRSPLHKKTFNQKHKQQQKNWQNTDKIKSDHIIVLKNHNSSKQKFVKYEEIRIADKWQTLRGKQNKEIPQKSKNQLEYPAFKESNHDTFSNSQAFRNKQQSPPKAVNIYNIDFKLAKPCTTHSQTSALANFGSSNLQKIRQKNYTPIRRKGNFQQQTVRQVYGSRDKSSNCSRSLSKGKLSLVTASRKKQLN